MAVNCRSNDGALAYVFFVSSWHHQHHHWLFLLLFVYLPFTCSPQAPPPASDRCLWSISLIFTVERNVSVNWYLSHFWQSFGCLFEHHCCSLSECCRNDIVCVVWHRQSQQKTSPPLVATAFFIVTGKRKCQTGVRLNSWPKRKDINLKWQAGKHS